MKYYIEIPRDMVVYKGDRSVHFRKSDSSHWVLHNIGTRLTMRFIEHESRGYKGRGDWRPNENALTKRIRGLSHGAMNLLTQEGKWAHYTGLGGTKSQSAPIRYVNPTKRDHTREMKAATKRETEYELLASSYARLGHGAFMTRGHAYLAYEWCHLVSHGHHGSDTEDNIVAATAYQNTEQMAIENALYDYRDHDLSITVRAKLAKGTLHLAECITYSVYQSGRLIYTKMMDARRATRPSYRELDTTMKKVRQCINNRLAAIYPLNGIDVDSVNVFFVENPGWETKFNGA